MNVTRTTRHQDIKQKKGKHQDSSSEEDAIADYRDLDAVQEEESGHDNDDTSKDSSTDDEESESVDDNYEGFAFLQKDILCSIGYKPEIPKSWILLDSQSTVDMFCNSRLLSNIRDAKWTLTLYCNAG